MGRRAIEYSNCRLACDSKGSNIGVLKDDKKSLVPGSFLGPKLMPSYKAKKLPIREMKGRYIFGGELNNGGLAARQWYFEQNSDHKILFYPGSSEVENPYTDRSIILEPEYTYVVERLIVPSVLMSSKNIKSASKNYPKLASSSKSRPNPGNPTILRKPPIQEAKSTRESNPEVARRPSRKPSRRQRPNFVADQGILLERNILYVPVPKAACTSMKLAIFKYIYGREFDLSSNKHDIHGYFRRLEDYTIRPKSYEVVLQIPTKFTVIRHPYSRLYSAWRNKILGEGDFESRERKLSSKIKFEDYVNYTLKNYNIHWAPYSELLRPDILNYKILKQESLHSELSDYLQSIGISLDVPVTNTTNSSDWQEAFTDSIIKKIRPKYKDDLELGGYDG